MAKNIINQIVSKFKVLDPIELSWCDSLVVENKKFYKITLAAELNEFNYLTLIKINFHAENPPGFIYTGEVKVTEFDNEEELKNLLKNQIKLANNSITDAIIRMNQLDLFR